MAILDGERQVGGDPVSVLVGQGDGERQVEGFAALVIQLGPRVTLAVTLQLPLFSTRLSSARSTSRPSALVPTSSPLASRVKVTGLPWLLYLPSRLC